MLNVTMVSQNIIYEWFFVGTKFSYELDSSMLGCSGFIQAQI